LYLSLCLALACFITSYLHAADAKVTKDILYKPGSDLTAYELERCKLDLYLPAKPGFPTLVWFHGGGLKTGDADMEFTRKIAQSLVDADIGFVIVHYRYSPKVTYPAYVEDAAASFAWTVKNIQKHGGNPQKVFIGGHSAGGYLAAIVGLDPKRLKEFGLPLDTVAGMIPVSGQMLTHYTIREERKLDKYNVISDEAAPIFHTRKDTPPMLVLYADKDMATREEENVYFISTMKAAGNKRVQGLLIKDRDHGSIARNIANPEDPARLAIIKFIREVSQARESTKAAK
ncbi:MAG: alpha/beta hydrolase, partial [Verrucomicrobiota bacterium]